MHFFVNNTFFFLHFDLRMTRYYIGKTVAVVVLIVVAAVVVSQRLSHACLSTSLSKVKPRMAH